MTGEMADNTSLGAALDISKLKVQDLKKELKARGLNTTGNKNELIERLQAALKNNDSGTNESVDDLDEDLLNEDDDLDTTDAVINNIDAALNDTLPPKQTPSKRKAISNNEESTENKSPPAKKLILNRNPSIIADTRVSTESKDSNNDQQQQNDKKVIKLSEISVKERLEMRASKFGVPLSTQARKVARAERFGITKISSTSNNIINNNVNTNIDVLKQRAERFGGSVSKVMSQIDQKERLEQRKQRFGEITAVKTTTTTTTTTKQDDVTQEQKKKQRLERFKQTVK